MAPVWMAQFFMCFKAAGADDCVMTARGTASAGAGVGACCTTSWKEDPGTLTHEVSGRLPGCPWQRLWFPLPSHGQCTTSSGPLPPALDILPCLLSLSRSSLTAYSPPTCAFAPPHPQEAAPPSSSSALAKRPWTSQPSPQDDEAARKSIKKRGDSAHIRPAAEPLNLHLLMNLQGCQEELDNDIVLDHPIGSGGYGTVYSGTWAGRKVGFRLLGRKGPIYTQQPV